MSEKSRIYDLLQGLFLARSELSRNVVFSQPVKDLLQPVLEKEIDLIVDITQIPTSGLLTQRNPNDQTGTETGNSVLKSEIDNLTTNKKQDMQKMGETAMRRKDDESSELKNSSSASPFTCDYCDRDDFSGKHGLGIHIGKSHKPTVEDQQEDISTEIRRDYLERKYKEFRTSNPDVPLSKFTKQHEQWSYGIIRNDLIFRGVYRVDTRQENSQEVENTIPTSKNHKRNQPDKSEEPNLSELIFSELHGMEKVLFEDMISNIDDVSDFNFDQITGSLRNLENFGLIKIWPTPQDLNIKCIRLVTPDEVDVPVLNLPNGLKDLYLKYILEDEEAIDQINIVQARLANHVTATI